MLRHQEDEDQHITGNKARRRSYNQVFHGLTAPFRRVRHLFVAAETEAAFNRLVVEQMSPQIAGVRRVTVRFVKLGYSHSLARRGHRIREEEKVRCHAVSKRQRALGCFAPVAFRCAKFVR